MAGGVLNNLSGTRFFKGYLYGLPEADAIQSVRFGALQSVNISHEFGTAELRGPEALPALGVGITEENLTGTAELATLFASHAKMLLGADVSVIAGNTRIRKLGNAEPRPFDLHLEDPDGGANIEVDLYRCIASTYNFVRASNRAWDMTDFAFKSYGKLFAGVHVLFDITLPGNQTDSTTSAGQPLALQ